MRGTPRRLVCADYASALDGNIRHNEKQRRSDPSASHSGRAVEPMKYLRPLKYWCRGFESTQGMDVCVRLFCICVVVCVGSGLAKG
jgi:hypothetical protein